MNKIAILGLNYYLDDKQLDFTQLDKENIKGKACDNSILEALLKDINTRFVDRQSMALEVALEKYKENDFYKKNR